MPSAAQLFAGRFELNARAALGGMSTIWRATDAETGEPVALKRMAARTRNARERFLREAGFLVELVHPGIVRHVAHGVTDAAECWIAMEWLEGEDLAARLARGPLPLADAVGAMERVADAMAVAHARGVIHRDLKPANVFLVGGDLAAIKIVDFGVARREGGLTDPGVVLGTLGYLSPEQA